LNFRIFAAYFLVTFPPEVAACICKHTFFVTNYDVQLIVRDACCYHHTHTSTFLRSSLAGSQRSAGLTNQRLLISFTAKN